MTHRKVSFIAFVWMAFAVATGAMLVDSAVQALRGHGSFAWWHLPTLSVGVLFTSMNLSAADRAFVAALLRLLRMKAAASFLQDPHACAGKGGPRPGRPFYPFVQPFAN